jgi:hypothetical protein
VVDHRTREIVRNGLVDGFNRTHVKPPFDRLVP